MALTGGYILSVDIVNEFITKINACQKKNGIDIEIPAADSVGLGNVLFSQILVFDSALVTTFKPIADLIKIQKDYVIPALSDPKKVAALMSKVGEYVSALKEILSNPIEFIVKELIKPLDNLLLPIPLDLSMLVPGMKVTFDKGFKTLTKDKREQIEQMISDAGDWASKIPLLIKMPIDIAIGIFTTVIKMIVEALTNPLVKIAELITKVVTNFKEFIIELLTTLVSAAVEPILATCAPYKIDIKSTIAVFDDIFKDIFGGISIDIEKYKLRAPDLDKVFGIVSIVICFIKTIFAFILEFPTLFFT